MQQLSMHAAQNMTVLYVVAGVNKEPMKLYRSVVWSFVHFSLNLHENHAL